MVVVSITRLKYPKNDTNVYEYKNIDNMLKDLKRMITNNYISKYDIIRIEVLDNE